MKKPSIALIAFAALSSSAFSATTVVDFSTLTGFTDGAFLDADSRWNAQTVAGSYTTNSGIASATASWLRARYVEGGATSLAVGDTFRTISQISFSGTTNGNNDFTGGVGEITAGLGGAVVAGQTRFTMNQIPAGGLNFSAFGGSTVTVTGAEYVIGDLLQYTLDFTKSATADTFDISVTLDNLTKSISLGTSTGSGVDAGVYANGMVASFQGLDLGGGTSNVHFAPIPEPASMTLALLGGLAVLVRRRK